PGALREPGTRRAPEHAAAPCEVRLHTPGEACPPVGGGGGSGRYAPEVPAQKVRLNFLAMLLLSAFGRSSGWVIPSVGSGQYAPGPSKAGPPLAKDFLPRSYC